jgi:hypothetical protein
VNSVLPKPLAIAGSGVVSDPVFIGAEARDAAAMARAERRLAVLNELTDIGMQLVREVGRQVLAQSEARDPAVGPKQPAFTGRVGESDLGLVFSRLARAVRQSVALAAKLDCDGEVQAQHLTAAQAARSAAEGRRIKKVKEQAREYVEKAIHESADGTVAENLMYDLDEWLEEPGAEEEFGTRGIGSIVAHICHDLNVEIDLRHFSDAELNFDTEAMKSPTRRASDLAYSRHGLAGSRLPKPDADTGDPPG